MHVVGMWGFDQKCLNSRWTDAIKMLFIHLIYCYDGSVSTTVCSVWEFIDDDDNDNFVDMMQSLWHVFRRIVHCPVSETFPTFYQNDLYPWFAYKCNTRIHKIYLLRYADDRLWSGLVACIEANWRVIKTYPAHQYFWLWFNFGRKQWWDARVVNWFKLE